MSAATHHHGGRSCREMFARLSEFIDGELPDDLCERIEGHLDDCEPCQRYLESLRRTVRLLERVPSATLPEEIRRELIETAARLRR